MIELILKKARFTRERSCGLTTQCSQVSRPPVTTRARLRGEFVGRAQDLRRDHTVDWVHLRLADPAHRTVMLTDPFGAHDERVDVLLQALAIS